MLITIALIAGGMAVVAVAMFRAHGAAKAREMERTAALVNATVFPRTAAPRGAYGRTLSPLREEVREQTRPLHDNDDSGLSTVLTVLAVEAMMHNDTPAAFDSSPAPDTSSSFAGFGGGDSGGGGGGGSWDGGGSSDSGSSFDSGSSAADSSGGSW